MPALESEERILSILDEYFPKQGHGLLLGRGDDCAVLAPGPGLAMTCDIFAENVHFRSAYFRPEQIGHKALAVNLSDLASCGARPEGFVLSLTLTDAQDEDWLRGFLSGMAGLASRHGVLLAGGDLSRSPAPFGLHISVSAWGRLPEALPLGLRRGTARDGDVLFVVGELGLARAGLWVLERALADSAPGMPGSASLVVPEAIEDALRRWPQSCAVHLLPEPLSREGMALADFVLSRRDEPEAARMGLMDLSDGLARDAPRLLDSRNTGLGADLLLPHEELPQEVFRCAALVGEDPALFAARGGEDYALLGACPPALWADLRRHLPGVRSLGRVRPGPFCLNGHILSGAGFDHFA